MKDESGNIRIADDVPKEEGLMIVADLKFLHSMSFRNPDAELIRVMKLSQQTAPALEQWLWDRVQVIVDESTQIEKAVEIESPSYTYENPDVLPQPETPTANPNLLAGNWEAPVAENKNVRTVMANIGSAIYYVGKQNKMLLKMKVDGFDAVPMSSPRSGIIQIGSGLFRPKSQQGNLANPANTIFRLSTFFHEARHSDGNGASLGFFHAVCPEGHDYAGYSACDRNLNGPYTVDALIARSFMEACDSCTVADKEVLKVIVLDTFSRVLKSTKVHRAPQVDPTAGVRSACEFLRGLGSKLPESCLNLQPQAPSEATDQEIPSTDWDDRPEGHRS